MAITSAVLIVCALLGLPCASGRKRKTTSRSAEGRPAKRTLKDGRLEECSKQDCTVASKVNSSFRWTPELRAAAKDEVEIVDDSINHTKESSCYDPVRLTTFADYPVNAIGRIHFYNPNGYGYRCSGAFVEDYSMVLTAGHCCWNTKYDAYNHDWEITLGYDHGGGTSYEAVHATINNNWKDGDHFYDYCILKVKEPATEYIEYWVEADPDDFWDSAYIYEYGYPQNYGVGQELWVEYAAMSDYDVADDDYDGILISSCSPFHGGNSGGPWITDDGYLIGLSSCHDGGDTSTKEKSPYLGTAFVNSCRHAGFCADSKKNAGKRPKIPHASKVTQIFM